MGLYDLTDGSLTEVAATTFESEGILERNHLQAAIRENVSVLGDDLLVVAEEFGDFDGANRRIDLLCVDRSARLVVIELKRTSDGGHLELQALRYAAMISTMTMDDLRRAFSKHLEKMGEDSDQAESLLAEWLGYSLDGAEPIIERDVKIILASAGFDKEITTTVLWLNELHGMEIQCIRLTPYRLDERVLLDVQPVIPLPEAAELTVQLRRRDRVARTTSASNRDRTRYIIVSPGGESDPLAKRNAAMAMVAALHDAGVEAERLAEVLSGSKFLTIPERLEGDELKAAAIEQRPALKRNLDRWFFDTPLLESDQTWVLSNQWGTDTEAALTALVAVANGPGFGFREG